MKLLLLISLAVYQSATALSSSTTPPPGLTYSGNYTVQANDTIFSIASTIHRGVCDVARANRMADAEVLRVGATLLVPSAVAVPDNDSCLLKTSSSTATVDCIYGGPHVYTVISGDTLTKIALKLNMSVSSLTGSTGPGPHLASDALLPEGRGLKIPQCSPSQCSVQPYRFVYGTYTDLAVEFNTTVGQIVAFNPTYSFSSTVDNGKAPVITLPMYCGPLSGNLTVIS